MKKQTSKKRNLTLRIKDKHGFGGGWAVLALMLIMLATTIIFCRWIMVDMADSVETLCKGEKDVEILGIDDSSGAPIPDTNYLTQKTYNWAAGIMMSFMGLAILGIAFSYFTGIFSPEAAVKAKAMGMKLILAICVAPFLWIPLYYVIKINQTMCQSFIGMSGVDISTQWCEYFTSGFQGYTLVPMFALAITGLGITLYCLLIFRLVFIMITYSVSPIAVILLVFPQTREFGGKLLKIFFESVFCLLFFDMGLIFCFKNISGLGLNNPMGFVFAVAFLAAPIAVYKVLWNPIAGAVGGAVSGGVGAITGVVGGGMGIRGATGIVTRKGGGRKGGEGSGAGVSSGAGRVTGVTGKLAEAGGGMAQADTTELGGPIGLAIGGGALAFKGGKKGIQAAAKRGREWKQDRKALGGAFGVIDTKKGEAYMLGEKHKTITGMHREAKKRGLGEDFSRKYTDLKQNRVMQHADEKKQQKYMDLTGRTAENYGLWKQGQTKQGHNKLNQQEKNRYKDMITKMKYSGQESRLQKSFNKIDNRTNAKISGLEKYENNGRSGFEKRGRNIGSENHRKAGAAVRPLKISREEGSPNTNGREKQGGGK